MSDPENPKQDNVKDPKIIVDTDWKEQVEREREIAGQSESSTDATEVESDDTPAPSEAGGDQEFPPPPPATLEVLVSMLFTQTMAMLGQMPDPASGETNVNKAYAKHYIDTLDMLNEKTEGNRTDNETKMLTEALHALRMMYVNAKE